MITSCLCHIFLELAVALVQMSLYVLSQDVLAYLRKLKQGRATALAALMGATPLDSMNMWLPLIIIIFIVPEKNYKWEWHS